MSINQQQFVWPTSFACTIITEKIILPNLYSINVGIEPNHNGPNNISLGFKKLRHFIDYQLNNSVFINQEHPLVKSLGDTETNVVLLPCDPYDYFVGGILYSKFLSITEKYFDIDLITIDSTVGDHVQYCLGHPEECGLDLKGDYWWNMDSTDTGQNKNTNWEDLDLHDMPRFEPKINKGGKSEN